MKIYDYVFLNQYRQCFTGGALVFNRAEKIVEENVKELIT